jgi:hypothetical protein
MPTSSLQAKKTSTDIWRLMNMNTNTKLFPLLEVEGVELE